MKSKNKATRKGAAENSGVALDDALKRIRIALDPLKQEHRAPLGNVLAAAGLPFPWVVRAPQHLRIKQFIRWFADSYLTPNDRIAAHFASELTTSSKVAAIVQAFSGGSLFHPREVVVIYDATALKAATVRTLAEALGESSSALLILGADGDKKGFLSDLVSRGTAIVMGELSDQQLEKWIEKETERAGSAIEPAAGKLLAAQWGKDLSALAAEIAKLAALTPRGEKISAALVRDISSRELDEESFRLLGSLLRGDALQSTVIAKRLLRQGFHPLQLSAFLSRALRVLCAAKDNPSRAAIHSELANFFFVRNVAPLASNVELPSVQLALEILGALDLELKSSGLGEEAVVERSIIKIANAARHAA